MATDSFKITDRRSAYTDKDEPNEAPQKPLAPTPPEPPPQQPNPTISPPPEADEEFGDSSEAMDERFDEGPLPDELPDDQLDEPVEPRQARGSPGRATPFSMRPIELTHSLLGLLVQKAYVSLGLMPNPETGRMTRDLDDAGESIELLEVLVKHFSGKWQVPGMEAELQNQLSNLRLQYARLKG
ncbi:MAG TPA: DUF1844 domain-containing protein [Candidatus Ozemobacteraceae bacterium]|nr:DUF1844 domain-containing protein [Candidatus Ozemobacteraceae bacterium]